MKVFFISTPRGKQELGDYYIKIHEKIEKLGFEHASDFITNVEPKDFYKMSHQDRVDHYKKMVEGIKRADIVVVETSLHSLAIGHITNLALGMSKPVVAMHLSGKAPYFLSGAQDDKLQIVEYRKDNIEKVLKAALEYASEQMDTRFNFFISPKIGNFLDWIAKKRRVPRAVYLRRLIESDMEKNKEYSKAK